MANTTTLNANNDEPIKLQITVRGAADTLMASDLSSAFTNGALGTLTQMSSTLYEATVTPSCDECWITVKVPAGVVEDDAGMVLVVVEVLVGVVEVVVVGALIVAVVVVASVDPGLLSLLWRE